MIPDAPGRGCAPAEPVFPSTPGRRRALIVQMRRIRREIAAGAAMQRPSAGDDPQAGRRADTRKASEPVNPFPKIPLPPADVPIGRQPRRRVVHRAGRYNSDVCRILAAWGEGEAA